MAIGTQIYLPFDEQVLTETAPAPRRRRGSRVVVGRIGSKSQDISREMHEALQEQDLDIPNSSTSAAADVVIDSVVGAGRTMDGIFSAVAAVVDLLLLGGRVDDYPCLTSPRPVRRAAME